MSATRVFEIGIVVCCASLAALVPSEAQAQAPRQVANRELIDRVERSVTAGDGTTFVVTEGTVRVPELRTGPVRGGTIDLAVVRIRRAGSQGTSAHILLAGGPGDSGVTLALTTAQRGGAAIFELFGGGPVEGDLIGIDQRGTGKSSPNLSTGARYDFPLDRAGSEALWRPIVERVHREVAADVTKRGIHLAAYNTRESAADVDDVRRALGYARVTLWGRSYGSHLALETLRQHAAHVERVVLVSPEGPDDTFKLPSRVDAVLQRLSERVARDPAIGPRVPDLMGLVRQTIARLAKAPVTIDVVHPLTRADVRVQLGAFDLQWMTAQALGDPQTASTLPAAFLEMAGGDFRRAAQIAVVQRSRLGVESGMKQMMDLSSGATKERLARIAREADASVLGNAINLPLMWLRDAWGAPDLGDAFRQPVTSSVPTLILVGDLDPRTPVENGREIVQHLSRGRLIVLENAGHQFNLFGAPPLRAVLARFLRGEPLDTDRLVLPAVTFRE